MARIGAVLIVALALVIAAAPTAFTGQDKGKEKGKGKAHEVEGKVTKVDPNGFTIDPKGEKKHRTFSFKTDTKYVHGDKSELIKGVHVTVHSSDGITANSIHFHKKKKK